MPLSEEKIAEYTDAFKLFDADGNGHIDAKELQEVLQKIGIEATLEQAQEMIAEVDKDKNGTIELPEFIEMMEKHDAQEEADDIEGLQMAFRAFDIDGNGRIDREELAQVMKNLGQELTAEEIDAMMKEADTDGDGTIDFEEFKALMAK
jgi:calmodulin